MASVKQAWIKKYGEEEGLRRFNEHKKKYGRTKEQLKSQYGDNYVKDLMKKKATHTLQYQIEKYGEEEGIKVWNSIIKKKTETQRQRREAGTIYKNGRTLCEYQIKYGVDEGYNRWLAKNKRQSYTASKQRYVDEFGKVLGEAKCRDIKNNSSLGSFIERYGTEEGTARYNDNCNKCGITEASMVLKYGQDLGIAKYKEWLMKVTQSTTRLKTRGYSKISQNLFWEVYNELDQATKAKCYFAELNQEYQFFVNHENGYPNKIIRVDFKCGNAIIEYDGSYWHQKSSSLDCMRDSLLESKEYSILRIGEIDYKGSKQEAINKCIKFINETA